MAYDRRVPRLAGFILELDHRHVRGDVGVDPVRGRRPVDGVRLIYAGRGVLDEGLVRRGLLRLVDGARLIYAVVVGQGLVRGLRLLGGARRLAGRGRAGGQ